MDNPPPVTRRNFLKTAAAAVADACLAPAWMQAEDSDPRLYHIRLTEGNARNLLENKMDQAVFKQAAVMKVLRQRFSISRFRPDSFIRLAAHVQIRRTVAEFGQANPWDTDQTRHEPITPESLIRRYKDHVSRFLSEILERDFADLLKKYPDAEQRRQVEEKNYAEIEKLLGRSVSQQLGYETVDEQGNITVNAKWQSVPTYKRPPLDFDHIFADIGLKHSPFLITAEDLKAAKVDVERGLKQLSEERAKDSDFFWAVRAARA